MIRNEYSNPVYTTAFMASLFEEEGGALFDVRQAILGQVVYAGDDLSGSEWDNRGWQSRREVRHSLFWLAAEACLRL